MLVDISKEVGLEKEAGASSGGVGCLLGMFTAWTMGTAQLF